MIARLGRKRAARYRFVHDGSRVGRTDAAIDTVVHRERCRLVAAAKARDVADGDIVGTGSSEGLFQVCLEVRSATKVTAHVGAHLHLGTRWRREVKVRIKGGDSVYLANGNVDARGKLLKLIRRQVAKPLLDRPELIEQGASVPLRPDHDGKN